MSTITQHAAGKPMFALPGGRFINATAPLARIVTQEVKEKAALTAAASLVFLFAFTLAFAARFDGAAWWHHLGVV